MEQSPEVDYPKDGIELGQGWDSIFGTKKSAIGVIFVDPQEDLGQKTIMEIIKVSDRHSLMKALDISAEFQYQGLGSGASAKSKFAQKVEVNSIFESFIAKAKVLNAIKRTAPAPKKYATMIASQFDKKKKLNRVKNILPKAFEECGKNEMNDSYSVRLTPSALKMANSSVDEFYRVYGNCFVSAITLGAELIAVMTFTEFEKEKRKNLEASFKGKYSGFEFGSAIEKSSKEYSKNNKLNINYYQAGGKGDPIPTNVEEFLDKIKNLKKLAADNPIPFKITLQSYDSLPNWPQKSVCPSATPYAALLGRLHDYQTLYDDIETIKDDPDSYLLGRGVDLSSLRAIQDKLDTGIEELKNTIRQRRNKDAQYEMPESAKERDYLFRLQMPLPRAYEKDFRADMDEEKLKKTISEFWIETKSEACKYIREDGHLKNWEIEDFKEQIPVSEFKPPSKTPFDPQRCDLQKEDSKLKEISTYKFDESKITLEAWFKAFDLKKRQVIITKTYDLSKEPYYQYHLELRPEGRLYFALALKNGRYKMDDLCSIIAKQWYHVTATYDGQKMELYLNGKLIKKRENLNMPMKYYLNRPVSIGGFGTKWPFKGELANVRIWKTARTEKQIITDMFIKNPVDSELILWAKDAID
jgi:hypothetical protein